MNYYLVKLIGEGTYGKVFVAERRHCNVPGPRVAIKVLSLLNKEEGVPPTTMREMALLKDLNHINIVKLFDVYVGVESIAFVFELCETNLGELIDSKIVDDAYLPREHVQSLIKQLLGALQHLHEKQVLHRDIKPQNVLLTQRVLKLADFGLSVKFGLSPPHEQRYCAAITLWYRPPELLLGEIYYSTAAEVWSVGCLFAELLMTQTVLNGSSECHQLRKVFSLLDVPYNVFEIFPDIKHLPFLYMPVKHTGPRLRDFLPRVIDPITQDLLMRMLCIDPGKRITVEEALAHPYFTNASAQETIRNFVPTLSPSGLARMSAACVPKLRAEDVVEPVTPEKIFRETLTRMAREALRKCATVPR